MNSAALKSCAFKTWLKRIIINKAYAQTYMHTYTHIHIYIPIHISLTAIWLPLESLREAFLNMKCASYSAASRSVSADTKLAAPITFNAQVSCWIEFIGQKSAIKRRCNKVRAHWIELHKNIKYNKNLQPTSNAAINSCVGSWCDQRCSVKCGRALVCMCTHTHIYIPIYIYIIGWSEKKMFSFCLAWG